MDEILSLFQGDEEKTSKLLEYFNQDEMAASTWLRKYALKNKEGFIVESTPDEMHKRMAKEFARIEENYVIGDLENNKNLLSTYGKLREDLEEESIYQLFKDFKYIIPQGSIMSQLGAKSIGSLSNCFVIGQPEDSYGGIFHKDEQLAQLMKRRGGVGIDISTLRPEGTSTSNAAKSSTGAISFMHRFSNTTREVAQNGRRGALMISININHPDVMEFIKIKRDLTQVTGANISIKLNDEFMKAVENDEDYALRFPCDTHYYNGKENYQGSLGELSNFEYNQMYEVDQGVYVKRIKAKEYWNEIIKSAHNVAEPGLMFWDNMVNYSPDGVYEQFKQVTTNPCSEIAMQPYDACRLIAVNLYSFVKNPFTDKAEFNFKKFYEVNYEAMRLSDDLIDLEIEHINKILQKIAKDPESGTVKDREFTLWTKVLETAQASRRTGLGFTALGDTLAALGLKYDSDEALEIIEKIMKMKMESELDCTIDLAILRGTFEGYDKNLESDEDDNGSFGNNDFYQFVKENFNDAFYKMKRFGRRNVSWSTVAPTGTVSLMCQTTSGIEPLFMGYYMRRRKASKGDRVDFTDQNGDTWQEFPVLHPKFNDWCELQEDMLYNIDEENPNIKVEELSKEQLTYLFEMSPWFKSTANDIDWIKRVEIQSIIQKYITHSISSTINLPEDVSEKEVSDIYLESWKKGLKGITVYRDGSRSGVLISNNDKKLITFNDNHSPKRPKKLNCKIIRFNNNYEKWVAFVGLMDNKPYEIFTGKLENIEIPNNIEAGEIVKIRHDNDLKTYNFIHKEGIIENISKVSNKTYWNYGKMISGMLRHGMPLLSAIDLISRLSWEEEHINTWKNGVVRALKKFIKDGEVIGLKCDNCGSNHVIFENGCSTCKECGHSGCS